MCTINYSEARHIKRLYIQSQSADPSPPLGTILGNLGVNTVSFCNNFNLYTKKLPSYFLLKVNIFIFDNKSISFTVDLSSTSFLLNLLKFDRVIKVRIFDRFNDKTISCIRLYSLLKLARLKFPFLALNQSVPIIWGTVKSMNLVVVRN